MLKRSRRRHISVSARFIPKYTLSKAIAVYARNAEVMHECIMIGLTESSSTERSL